MLDYLGLRGREKPELCPRLAKAEKQGESQMIRCLEMILTRLAKVVKPVETKKIWCLEVALYQSCESKTKKGQFVEDSEYISTVFNTFSHSTISYILSNKKKRIEADYIFIYQRCCSSMYTT